LLFACKKQHNYIYGEWRGLVGQDICDYSIRKDSVFYKCSWDIGFMRRASFQKKDVFYAKERPNFEDERLLFKLVSIPDSNSLIILVDGEYLAILERLRKMNLELPLAIRFDMYANNGDLHPSPTNDEYKTGHTDYYLKMNGDFFFKFAEKTVKGKVGQERMRQLAFYLTAIDTTDQRTCEHYFGFFQDRIDYRLDFIYKNKTQSYMITNRQLIQLTRVTNELQNIWANFLLRSGHCIM